MVGAIGTQAQRVPCSYGGATGARRASHTFRNGTAKLLRRIYFHDAPETQDFFRWSSAENGSGFHALTTEPPLHLKPHVGTVHYDRVGSLYTSSTESKRFFQRQRGWADDFGRYAELMSRRVAGSRVHRRSARFAFSADDTRAMDGVKYDICGAAEYWSEPWSFCAGWSRAEKENTRRRPLFESFVNDQFREGDLEPMRQSTATRVRKQVRDCTHALLFDFESWYDQLPLIGVRGFFGVRLPDGRTATLRSMPMGFKGSCHLAQSVTWVLADFLGQAKYKGKVFAASCIDNVRFTSSDTALLKEAGAEFVRRCLHVGATLNPFSLEPTQTYEYLGVAYDHVSSTRCLAGKSVRKLGLALDCLAQPSCTRRQLAATFGIALYAADVLLRPETSLAHHFRTLQFFRRNVAAAAEHEWDDEMIVPTSVRDDLARWLTLLQLNQPVPVAHEDSDYDMVLITDACELGWGALCWCPATGTIEMASGTWTGNDCRRDMGQSTVSEPAGIRKGMMRFVSAETRRVLVLSDHTGVCFALRAGHGRSEDYNELCLWVTTTWPALVVDAAYTPGATNPTDASSRGDTSLQTADVAFLQHLTTAALQKESMRRDTGEKTWMV